MKIKLTTSANIESDILSKLDMKFGFAFYSYWNFMVKVKNTENSFFMKILSKLSPMKDKYDQIKNEDKEIIEVIGQSVEYLNNVLSEKSLKQLYVQINVSSNLQKKYKKYSSKKTQNLLSTEGLFIASQTVHDVYKGSFVILGIDKIKSFFHDMQKNYKKKLPQYVLFHEIGHLLDTLHNKTEPLYMQKLNKLSTNDNLTLLELECELFTGKLPKLHTIIYDNLIKMQSEMYADVSAILYIRNYDIKNKIYDINTLNEFTKEVIKERYKEYQQEKERVTLTVNKNLPSEKSISSSQKELINGLCCNHFTSFALLEMNQIFLKYGNEHLTEDQICEITKEQVIKGFSKFLEVGLVTNNKITEQIKILSMIEFESKPNSKNKIEIDSIKFTKYKDRDMAYGNMLSNIKNNSGDEWVYYVENKLSTIIEKDNNEKFEILIKDIIEQSTLVTPQLNVKSTILNNITNLRKEIKEISCIKITKTINELN